MGRAGVCPLGCSPLAALVKEEIRRFIVMSDESIFINRELGTSKMNSSIFGEAVFGVIKLKVNSWFHTFPQKTKMN